MDYKKIMEDNDKCFPEYYQEVCEKIESRIGLTEEFSKKLRDKREFGLNKYKEFSFQSNFDNYISVPCEEHFIEELVDAMNYIIHLIHVRNFLMHDNKEELEIAKKIYNIYAIFNKLTEPKHIS